MIVKNQMTAHVAGEMSTVARQRNKVHKTQAAEMALTDIYEVISRAAKSGELSVEFSTVVDDTPTTKRFIDMFNEDGYVAELITTHLKEQGFSVTSSTTEVVICW